jgi:hypothetical protein
MVEAAVTDHRVLRPTYRLYSISVLTGRIDTPSTIIDVETDQEACAVAFEASANGSVELWRDRVQLAAFPHRKV